MDDAPPQPKAPDRTTLLVGNPNVGKSVLFGVLTGRYQNVSNYPGTTVEIATGRRKGADWRVIDTPGTNSLIPGSEDEQAARDILLDYLSGEGARILQVADTKNLRRGLALALQMGELEFPVAFVANMHDEARSRGIDLDADALARELGVEVLPTVATRREGLSDLLGDTLDFRPITARIQYDQAVEEAVLAVSAELPDELRGKRGLSLMLLAGDHSLVPWAEARFAPALPRIEAIRQDLARRLPEPIRFSINRARMAAADRIGGRVLKAEGTAAGGAAQRFGRWAMHPVWGWPIAAAALYAVYLFVGVLGAGEAVDFLENTLFGQYLTPWMEAALRAVLPAGTVADFLIGPPGTPVGTGQGLLIGEYGLVSMALSYSVAIVLPIVGFFFITFSIMEDSGYLPRLAVVLNRAFKVIGLNGKAVLPMILGLGCDTMATMTARILPTQKERVLVTLLLALAVPCSAQLGVILGMLAGLSLGATLWWVGTVILVMVAVGWLGAKVLPGQTADFLLEVPPMRRPALVNVAIKTVARIEWYLKEAVPLFILGTFVLWVLDRLAFLQTIQVAAAPLVESFLGLPTKATDAFLIGFLRRDYGAAGLYDIFQPLLRDGNASTLVEIQVVVSMVVITLFIPCIANVFMIIKERGLKTAIAMGAFILPFAFLVGGLLNQVLRAVWL